MPRYAGIDTIKGNDYAIITNIIEADTGAGGANNKGFFETSKSNW